MLGDAPSSNPPPSTLLAPGFRFHPTDEELVSYYLKRKVSGRPLRIDAIAEIDLYKSEPWDLPSRSRLRSRDMEWYFFSPLDRKYANRSRTNRATAEGYWKTTGKDRPVRHGSQIVGMKKTLVFHVGRAPRGERTNWVMHEYRLEDGDLALAGIPQDAYVVCRIFRKNGTGPQNGAQYGAPFLEEEWEGADDLVPVREGGVGVVMDAGDQEYVQFDDFEQKQDLGNEHEITAHFAAESDGQDGGSHPEDPTIILEEILEDHSFYDDMGTYISAPGLQDDPTLTNNIGENTGMGEHSHSPPDQNDGYVELQDIFDIPNVDCPENPVDCFLGASNYEISVTGVDETITLPEGDGIEFFLDTLDETADPQELSQRCLPVEGDFNLQPYDFLNPVAGDYPNGQPSEDNTEFYDAPSYDLPLKEDSCVNTNELLFSPVADLSGFDMVDDLMAYFDATDNNLHHAALESSEKSEFVNYSGMAQSKCAPEVKDSSLACKAATPQAPGATIERGASSSARLAEADNQLESFNEDFNGAPDVQGNEGWNKALRKRVVNMLGSISAPPAMAEDPHVKGKSVGQISATHSSSSIHVSAGMIQIYGLAVMESAEHWTLEKNGDMGFFLSYGMAGNDVGRKSVCFEPITKMQGGVLSVVLRGGFSHFCLSMLILAVSFKVGMCVYNK